MPARDAQMQRRTSRGSGSGAEAVEAAALLLLAELALAG